jgi:4-amino-4-deoxy-L-arabinose transferase-like glycosyltransferase
MSKKILSIIFLILILVAAVGLRTYHLSFKSISIDEAIGALYSVESVQRVLIFTVNDVHPPLFYIIHHFWIRLFGWNESALRSISVFFGLLSVASLFYLGKLIFNRKTGMIAAFLLAISPWHIWISQNARSNSLLLFLIIISTYSFYQIFLTGQKKWFIIYCTVTLLGIYTHYFAFMVWIAQTMYVTMSSFARNNFLKTWIISQIIVLTGYFPWLPFMISQFFTKSRPLYKSLTPEFLKNLYDFLNPYAAIQNVPVFIIGEIIFFIFIILGLIFLFRRRSVNITNKAAFDYTINTKVIRILKLSLIFFVFTYLTSGLFLNSSWTLGLLKKHIALNSSIYAETVKPYHEAQLRSFSLSFYFTSIIGFFLLLLLHYVGFVSNHILIWMRWIEGFLKKENNSTFSRFTFLSVHSVFPLLIAGLISIKSPYLLIRNMIIFIPAWYLVLALAISSTKRIGFVAFLLTTVFFAGFSFLNFERWMTKDDWRAAAQVAKQNLKEGDVVLLDHLFGKKPFYYYGVPTAKPLTKENAHPFLATIKGDVWLLFTYDRKREWYAYNLLNAEWNRVSEWRFEGTTNIDDMRPVDDVIRLVQYRNNKSKN